MSEFYSAESYEGSCSKKYQDHIPCSFAYKIVCVDDKFSNQLLFLEAEMQLMSLLKWFLKSLHTVKK